MRIIIKYGTFVIMGAACCGLFSSPSYPATSASGNYQLTSAVMAVTGTSEQSSGGYKLMDVGIQIGSGTGESASNVITSGGLYTLIATYGKATPQVVQTFSATATPKNVPNPFRPRHNQGTTIVYTLDSDMDTKIIVYDITGKTVWQKSFAQGTDGGRANANDVYWDGKNDFGQYVGNGAYIYVIASGKKIISKGQMAVMD